MLANTELNSGKTTDDSAFKPYEKGSPVMPNDMKSNDYSADKPTPTPRGKTSAPHQQGSGHGVSTTGA